MIVELEHPGSKRSVSVAGVPIKFTETPGTVRLRAPLLGEHSESILAGLEGARVEGRVASDV
jgi:crotonobetainyl-CoA:carnitine CoA-transferase CaiB-like acyl-CoA transferase